MPFNYEYPYCNTERYNSDWMLKQMQELTNWINSTATDDIKEFVYTMLNNIIFDATYIPETETIVLKQRGE